MCKIKTVVKSEGYLVSHPFNRHVSAVIKMLTSPYKHQMAPLVQICVEQDSLSLCRQTEGAQVREKTDCSLHQHFKHSYVSRNHTDLKQQAASDIQSSVSAAERCSVEPGLRAGGNKPHIQ